MSSRKFDADEALKLGVVDRVLTGEQLMEAERAYAADDNIGHSTRATDFITPKSRTSLRLRNAVLELARTHDALVTVEEVCVMGGAGAAVSEALAAAGMLKPVLHLGLPDIFVEHGDPAKLLSMCGLDAKGIEQSILKRFGPPLQLVVSPAAVNG
jgi:deoxyxylulose-5-phosphate synthase